MLSLIIASNLLAQAVPIADTAPKNLTVEQVLDRWEAGANLIASYELNLELKSKLFLVEKNGKSELVPENDATILPSNFSRIYRKAGKRRGEFGADKRGRFSPPIIWDGKAGYVFAGHSVTIDQSLPSFGSSEYEDYESTFRTVMGTIDRIALSKQRKSKLLPRDGRFWVVEVPTATQGDFANMRWTLWLDPDRNFMPTRIEQWMNLGKGGDARSLDIVNNLSEVSPGVWAPVRSIRRVYYKDAKSPFHGKNSFICELKVELNKSKFNTKIDDSLFDTTIPAGTTVLDRRKSTFFTK